MGGNIMSAGNVKKTSQRNGKIELLRFIFCMAVLLFHCEKYVLGEPSLEKGYHLSLFCHGSMGVEFFFLVSGFLMAKSISKKIRMQTELQETLAKESLGFLKRKITSIFPMHVMTFILAFIAYILANHMNYMEVMGKAVESIPSFFLIQMSGINLCSPNHITWYISCMLIAMAVLYPLCRKYYEFFTHYLAPLIAVLILGACIATTGRITGVSEWTVVCYKSVLRAVSEIALGTTGFEIAQYISKQTFTYGQRIGLAILEIILFLCVMIYEIGTFPSDWEVIELFAILALVVLAFSGVGAGSFIFNNSLCYHLGKLSLPLYLAQLTPIYFICEFGKEWPAKKQIAGIVVGTFLLAYLVFGADYLLHHRKGSKQA